MAGTAAPGLSRELRTQPIRNRPRTSRRGQVEHRPVAISPASGRPPRQAHSQRATSCRNRFLIRDRGSNFTASSGRRLPGRQRQDLAHRRPGAADERDLRAPDRHPAPRVSRPQPRPRQGTPAPSWPNTSSTTTPPGSTWASTSASPAVRTILPASPQGDFRTRQILRKPS